MTEERRVDQAKALLQRLGRPDAPLAEPVVPEIRSNDEISPRTKDASIDYVFGAYVVEWTFNVPAAEVETFHKFLKDKEKFIADSCQGNMPGVLYLGTYWNIGLGQGYRTYWAYDSPDAMKQWDTALRDSPNLAAAVQQLRSYWARDTGRGEAHFQPAAMFADLSADAARNPFSALAVVAAAPQRRSRRQASDR